MGYREGFALGAVQLSLDGGEGVDDRPICLQKSTVN
jgi:hypothetical protein